MSSPEMIRLQHMRDAAAKAVKHAQGRHRADLDTDELFGLGIVRLLEIIGEASKNVTRRPRTPTRTSPGGRSAGLVTA